METNSGRTSDWVFKTPREPIEGLNSFISFVCWIVSSSYNRNNVLFTMFIMSLATLKFETLIDLLFIY